MKILDDGQRESHKLYGFLNSGWQAVALKVVAFSSCSVCSCIKTTFLVLEINVSQWRAKVPEWGRQCPTDASALIQGTHARGVSIQTCEDLPNTRSMASRRV